MDSQMHGQRMARGWIAAVVLALALGLGACGGTTAEKAVEGSSQDGPALEGVSAPMEGYMRSYTDFFSALIDEDIPASRTAVDSMTDAVKKAQDKALDIESTDLRQTTQDYLDAMARVATAADRTVAYYEDDTVMADAQLENDLWRDLEDAVFDAHGATNAFVNRVMDKATPGERDAIREHYRQQQQALEDALGG